MPPWGRPYSAGFGSTARRRRRVSANRNIAVGRRIRDRRSAPRSSRTRSASRTAAATAGRRTPSPPARRRARPTSGSSAGPTSTVARSTADGRDPRSGRSSSRKRLRKWIVALRPRPNDTVSATTLANCSPSPDQPEHRARRARSGKCPAGSLASITTNERNARPMKAATKMISIVSAAVELADHVGAVARGDGRQTGHGDRVAGMRVAHLVRASCPARRPPAEAGLHRCPGMRPETTTASCSAEMKRRVRCSGSMSTYCFSVATSGLPAFSASQRRSVSSDQTLPTPACFSTIGWTSAIVGERLRRIERCALREFDQHVDRIGAGELGVETAAGGDRLLACPAPGRRGDSAARAWRR